MKYKNYITTFILLMACTFVCQAEDKPSPDSAAFDAKIAQAQTLYKDGKTDLAMNLFDEISQTALTEDQKIDIALTKAELLYRDGKTSEARAFFAEISQEKLTEEQKIEIDLTRAEFLYENSEMYSARKIFNKLNTKTLTPEQQEKVAIGVKETKRWWYKYCMNMGFFWFCIFFINLGIFLAKRGYQFTIRKIPGLDQITEAVGRATEMGRPSMFCVGVSNMDHPETFAAMPILKHIAKAGAKLRNRLLVPICSERTITLQQTTYREACQSMGELQAYNPSDVRFFPGGQVYFTAATMGYMLRERPAACFYFGYWEAESLMISETGQVIGAMQIAGTSSLFQIPFFIAACDYVIIGEEFFAVSASLSKDPILCGSLFGQDWVKVIVLLVISLGTVAISIKAFAPALEAFIKMMIQ